MPQNPYYGIRILKAGVLKIENSFEIWGLRAVLAHFTIFTRISGRFVAGLLKVVARLLSGKVCQPFETGSKYPHFW